MTVDHDDRPVPNLDAWAPYAAEGAKLAAVGIVVVVLLNAYSIVVGPFEEGRDWFLLNQESNPSTWLSVMLLAISGLLAGVCAVVDTARRRTFWLLGMIALLLMSLDDTATIHERVGGLIDDSSGGEADISNLWVVPWALLAVGIGVVLWRLRPQLPSDTRRWLVIGAVMSIGAAVILEVVATETVNSGGTDTEKLSLYSVEETLEMVGALILAVTMGRHALRANRVQRGVLTSEIESA